MKKLLVLCILLFFTNILVSCSNLDQKASTNPLNETISTYSKDSTPENDSNNLLSRIENLEKETNSLKAALANEKNAINNDTIISAFDKNDDVLLSTEKKDGYLNSVHVKVPKGENLSYKFYLLTGTEVNGILILNCLIKPQIDTSNNPEKIDVDLNKFSLYKLMTSNIKYTNTSIMQIIIKDSNGKEYSQFIQSDKFMGDV